MGDFSADWLSLREPADHAARSALLTSRLVDALGHDPAPRILDLAAGTGSNFRYLTEALPHARWLLVDSNAALLARAPKDPRVETRQMNLAPLGDPSIFVDRALVTASALLDLVSEPWLDRLVSLCALHRSRVLFTLSYDGRILCSPEDSDDAAIVRLVNQHQRTDKGFAPALGPDATDAAADCLRKAGYQVSRAFSDWTLKPESDRLQRPLVEGWAQAAAEAAPSQAVIIEAWRARRLAHIDAGHSDITVGHEDLAAWIP